MIPDYLRDGEWWRLLCLWVMGSVLFAAIIQVILIGDQCGTTGAYVC